MAPKCQRPECPKRTKRCLSGAGNKYQLGADGKRYRLYCCHPCALQALGEKYVYTPARQAAMMRANVESHARAQRRIVRTLADILKPYITQDGHLAGNPKDIARSLMRWGKERRDDGYQRGVRAERARAMTYSPKKSYIA